MRRVGLLMIMVAVLGVVSACGLGAGAGGGEPAPVSGSSPAPSVSDPWGTVRGVVRDGAGRPVVGVLVVPTAVDASTPRVPEVAVSTDAHGRYEWRLLPGRYRLVVRHGDRRTTSQTISVARARPSTVDIHLTG